MSGKGNKSHAFREYPLGTGDMRSGRPGDNMVNLDVLIQTGSRSQRRFALRELSKLKKAAG